jgi:hypothetical protein
MTHRIVEPASARTILSDITSSRHYIIAARPRRRTKTRHRKWPSETEGRTGSFAVPSGTRRLAPIIGMGPVGGDFGDASGANAGDQTSWLGRGDSNSRIQRHARNIHSRKDWTSAANGASVRHAIGTVWPYLDPRPAGDAATVGLRS